MHRNQSVDTHKFSMVPSSDVPRSSFRSEMALKTAFDASYLIPVYVDEVLPGDSMNLRMHAFSRLTTPLYPIMDNMHLESFWFFVPDRIVWQGEGNGKGSWQKFMGERYPNPDSSIDYRVPWCVSPAGGYPVNSLQDYMGLPTVGQMTAGKTVEHNALFLRAYNMIWNEWFRDQNLQNAVPVNQGDGPDNPNDYVLLKRGKRHDYFTACLPWPQKGDPVGLPLTGNATFSANLSGGVANIGLIDRPNSRIQASTYGSDYPMMMAGSGQMGLGINPAAPVSGSVSGIVNLSQVTAATINQLREAFQLQRFLERDARGGTRYTEIVRSHFGVISPDARLQRPEYLGGGYSPVTLHPIAQTSATGVSGSSAPLGTLGAMGTNLINGHGFNASFTEHGMVIGLVSVRADLTYQQGLHKMWSRKTRHDFYWPVFAHLGEQAVLNKEIYVTGDPQDEEVFGYQERWAEYRHKPSRITGQMRSTFSNPLDAWHLAQKFTNRPALNADFIQDGTREVLSRNLAVGAAALGQQFYFDAFFNIVMARPMPMYSVPGMIDHF